MGLAFFDELQANASQFSINIKGLPDALVTVSDFTSHDDAMAEDFHFNVRVVAKQALQSKQLLGQDATLSLLWSNSVRTLSGLVSEVVGHGQNQQGYHYTVVISSLLTMLKHSHSNRIFTGMSVGDIVRSVLQKAGFPMARLQVQARGPVRDMTVQYDESDYEFVTRLMRRYGLVYSVVEVSPGVSNLVVVERASSLSQFNPPVTLSYVPPSGQVRLSESVFAVSERATLTTHSVRFDDYNYMTPGNVSGAEQNRTNNPGFGQQQQYGLNAKTDAEAKSLAKVAQAALDCQRHVVIFDTDCRALRPGTLLTLQDHPEFSGTYLVIRVEHQGSQSHSLHYGDNVKGLTYKNQVYAIANNVDFKAEVQSPRRVFATFSATIEQEVDDKGEYMVNLPFNVDGEGQASKPTRLMQPYGGAGHGMHFPLTAGTEVLVCGEHGDLDRPIILGALYNQNATSPVNAFNPTENRLVTRAGHSLLMDDKSAQEKIVLATKEGKNKLELNATEGAHFAELASQDGDLKLNAKESVQFEAGGNINHSAKQNITLRAEQAIQMQSIEGNIEVRAKQALSQVAQSDVHLVASEGALAMKAQQEMKLQARDDVSVYSSNGNLELQAKQGEVNIQSGSNITISTGQRGSIQLLQGRSSVEIDAAGNLSIDAQSITLSAQNIVIKGKATSNN
ncbi:type VI secretion system Vgr family protein [Pseudoalteromonas fenneropenaei]|uniref:Type VI secretion system Vgr family protein n=1 Tax=Pseudoalteromonas fenneropenaei TaxID=1737459 RepID=A0ABV7CHZ0_9GAMM